jgi:hypothetical protein
MALLLGCVGECDRHGGHGFVGVDLERVSGWRVERTSREEGVEVVVVVQRVCAAKSEKLTGLSRDAALVL